MPKASLRDLPDSWLTQRVNVGQVCPIYKMYKSVRKLFDYDT